MLVLALLLLLLPSCSLRVFYEVASGFGLAGQRGADEDALL